MLHFLLAKVEFQLTMLIQSTETLLIGEKKKSPSLNYSFSFSFSQNSVKRDKVAKTNP